MTTGRLEPGTYRVLVVNWAGAATQAAVEGTLYDSSGTAGGAAPADALQMRSLLIP